MVHSRLFLVLLLLAGDPAQLLAVATDELRTWSDLSGRFTVTASLVACEGGQARLRKTDGRLVDVPLERLSEADRQYIAERTPPTARQMQSPQQTRESRAAASAAAERRRTGRTRAAADGDAPLGSIELAADAVVTIATAEIDGSSGMGSGFVIDPRGIIVTNYHVIEDAASAQVRFRDGTTAEVAGCLALDEGRDLAILKVDRLPRGVRPLVENPAPRPGLATPVIAIGHPHGFSHTISRGTVNAVRRTAELPPEIRTSLKANPDTLWIQTDAVISNGSSGGPILDPQGRVLGVATWIVPGEQIGFAVHVSHVVSLMRQATAAPQITPLPLNEATDHPMRPLDPEVRALLNQVARWVEERVVQEGQDLELANIHPGEQFVPLFCKLANERRGTRTAFQALFAGLQLAATDPADPGAGLQPVVEQLLRDHLAEPGLKYAALNLATTDAEPARAFLKTLAKDAQQADTRGCAAIALAANLERTSPDDEDDRALRIRMLEFAIRHVGELEINGKSLKDLAHRQLFAARNLSVGVAPPPLEARDVDGSPFSLKNQRGKVAIVLFSASWCRYSEPLYPHLRNYLRQYGDDAVTVLGVFQDPPSEVSKLQAEGKVAWQSVAMPDADGLFAQWQIGSLPTVYVIDSAGIIRYRGTGSGGAALDRAVAKLLRPAAANGPLAGTAADSRPVPAEAIRPGNSSDAPLNRPPATVPLGDSSDVASAEPGEPVPGREPAPVRGESVTMLELTALENTRLDEGTPSRPLNNLAALRPGEGMFTGVPFRIGTGFVQLKGSGLYRDYPESMRLPVNQKFQRLYVLHGTAFYQPGDSNKVGSITLRYTDGTHAEFPVVYDYHVADWWFRPGAPWKLGGGKVGWTGSNAVVNLPLQLALYVAQWDNPHPGREVEAIEYRSMMSGETAPFCVGMTVASDPTSDAPAVTQPTLSVR